MVVNVFIIQVPDKLDPNLRQRGRTVVEDGPVSLMSQPEFETHISELREDSKPGDGLIELKHEENQVTQVNTRIYPNVLRYSLDRIFFLFTQRLSHSLSLKIIRSEHWKIH